MYIYCAFLHLLSQTAPRAVAITYVEPDGTEKTVDAQVGQNLLDVAHDNNIELEGACGGELACSTCHLIFDKAVYDTLPEMEDEEEDMLDLAFEVTETSRLGCQIIVRDDFEGIKVRECSFVCCILPKFRLVERVSTMTTIDPRQNDNAVLAKFLRVCLFHRSHAIISRLVLIGFYSWTKGENP